MRIAVFLIGLAVLFGLLMYRFPYALASDGEKSDAVYYVILLTMVSASLFARRDISWKQHGQYALAWMVIIFVLLVGYIFWGDIQHSRFMGELMPSQARLNDRGEIVLQASEDGHFYVEALVDGAPVRFMVDTGASGISLSHADAARAGIPVDSLTYNIPHTTANGVGFSASRSIARLQVAGLVFENLPVSVAKKGRMDFSLLGMTFLKQMQSYRVEGDTLTLVP